MSKKRQQIPKAELLKRSSERAKEADAKHRNAITLDKLERVMVAGLQARDREIANMMAPLQADVSDFMLSLEGKYEVIIGKTHTFDWDRRELVPMPEKVEEPKQAALESPSPAQPAADLPEAKEPSEEAGRTATIN